MTFWHEYRKDGEYVPFEEGMNVSNMELVRCEGESLPDGAFSYNGFIRKNLMPYRGFESQKIEVTKGGCSPAIISDNIEVLSHGDGQMYSSKSAYYKSLKEKNLVINEPGMVYKKEGLNEKKFDNAFRQALEQHS
jgi:hypothetical protein